MFTFHSSLIPVMFFAPVKSVNPFHFIFSQAEMVQLGIFFDMIGVAGAGDNDHALMQFHSA